MGDVPKGKSLQLDSSVCGERKKKKILSKQQAHWKALLLQNKLQPAVHLPHTFTSTENTETNIQAQSAWIWKQS